MNPNLKFALAIGASLIAILILWRWWENRKCPECGSGITLRHKSTSGPDSHRNGVWHVYHHTKCLRCKKETKKEELTHNPPLWLRREFVEKRGY